MTEKEQADPNPPMASSDFEVVVAMSRKWNANAAGEEIGQQIKEKMKHTPKFVLLFSTIHYEKHGGFTTFLEAVNKKLPTSPIIGGTFSGFANNIGCFARGATALAVYHEHMNVRAGFGRNVKRSPKKAAENCLKMLNQYPESKYKNKTLFEFIASGTVPKYTGLGRRRVLKLPQFVNSLVNPLLYWFTLIFQFGAGREEEVLDILSNILPAHKIIGGSTSDDNRWEKSYQFFNNMPLQNSVVALSVETDLKDKSVSETGFKSTGIKMTPTNIGNFECSITKLNNKPASNEFCDKLGWPKDLLDEKLHQRTLYYPLGTKTEHGEYLRLIGLVIGSNLVFSNRIKPIEMEIYTTSGTSLIQTIDTAINKLDLKNENKEFAIVVSCTARLQALGRHIHTEQEKLKQAFKEKPFVVIYASGEDTVDASQKWLRRNESFNITSFAEE